MRPILAGLTILVLLAPFARSEPETEATAVHREARRVLFEVYKNASWDPAIWGYRKDAFGSGIGYRADGWILTTAHQVRDAKDLTVVGPDGVGRRADRWIWSHAMDVGLVHVPDYVVPVARWGDSNALRVGATLYAVGLPWGYHQTMTRGILSGIHRNLRLDGKFTKPFQSYLQTDAQVYSGNSGGPLLDGKGEVVGLVCETMAGVTKMRSDVSFAVPSRFFRRLADRLIAEQGKIRYGAIEAMHANCRNLPLAVRAKLGCRQRQGAILYDLKPSAKASGLKEGDVVVSVDGEAVITWMHLRVLLGLRSPGEEVTLEIIRKGEVRKLAVKLARFQKR